MSNIYKIHITVQIIAARMSMGFRVPMGLAALRKKSEKKDDDYQTGNGGSNGVDKKAVVSIVKSNSFKVASRVQLNISEYSGVFMCMLLYIQSEMNRGKALSTIGLYSIYGTVIGQYLFAIGFSMVKTVNHTNIAKVIGATMRYFAMAGLLYEIYALTKA